MFGTEQNNKIMKKRSVIYTLFVNEFLPKKV